MKTQALKAKWHKDLIKDDIRELQMDEIRLRDKEIRDGRTRKIKENLGTEE